MEIFEVITSYLSRDDQTSLRLVCKEFEAKIAARYFRNVVVPFRSELYTSFAPDDDGVLRRQPTTVLSDGMRIFQSFGRHILRFALSLELDENLLRYPPIKPMQEAVPAFWGIYRWPHRTYFRYKDLSSLEQTADETNAMREALKCLVKVTNIGLCCDAGLGFLLGPDVPEPPPKHPVFAPPQDPSLSTKAPSIRSKSQAAALDCNSDKFKYAVLHKMASGAGYRGSQIPEAIEMLLETEETSLDNIDFDERRSRSDEKNDTAASRQRTARSHIRAIDASLHLTAQGEEGHAAPGEEPPDTRRSASKTPKAFKPDMNLLAPADLTRSQKEMIVELEWAHRAMIQSFAIGIIDNTSDGAFQHLTTLTIAKIPSSHIFILGRHELWDRLAALEHVSLGVVPDWRRIQQTAPGCIDDIEIEPSQAVKCVFPLLNEYIGAQKNIHTLHFEWVGGGEFADGSYQRNHNINPAPFFEEPKLIAETKILMTNPGALLSLPFVKHLSLKNCWSSPHVFLQFLRGMALSSLETLELESVSLSGPPTTALQHTLLQSNTPHGRILSTFDGLLEDFYNNSHYGQGLLPLRPVPPLPGRGPWLQKPTWSSWAGIIEHFSPSTKIRTLPAQQTPADPTQPPPAAAPTAHCKLKATIPQSELLVREESRHRLRSISIKSCGYASVCQPYLDTRAILPTGAQGLNGNSNPHLEDLGSKMQTSTDSLLACISLHIPTPEVDQLVHAYGMRLGWLGVYSKNTIKRALADGVSHPGNGRFSGVLERSYNPGR